MGMRDILVLIDREPSPVEPYALALAAALKAHATAACVIPEPQAARYGGWEIPSDIFRQAREQLRQEAEKALGNFAAAAQLAGVACETLVMTTEPRDPDRGLARLAGHFDMVVIEQADPAAPAASNDLAEIVLFGSGRPVLMVPYIQRDGPAFGTVLVAWDGSQVAARSVGDAVPLLTSAKRVQVVTVLAGRQERPEIPGFDIVSHLSRHGINVELRKLVVAGNVANTLLSHATDVGADLLIMGGYGHSRFREFVLGGTTRTIMQTMTVPTFMAH
ncbi:universal stress protein [Phreatobacter stygius]|uniref:Universal stress protein n=1 Tax=Phreatobacter stygius TaxID=1940610 RepID=A0A4D7B2J3_9HYPH|nr:universal stress protein [Phreatobacter stygius]QCI67071.1 universal stress protein [Phreatobacter stygius]